MRRRSEGVVDRNARELGFYRFFVVVRQRRQYRRTEQAAACLCAFACRVDEHLARGQRTARRNECKAPGRRTTDAHESVREIETAAEPCIDACIGGRIFENGVTRHCRRIERGLGPWMCRANGGGDTLRARRLSIDSVDRDSDGCIGTGRAETLSRAYVELLLGDVICRARCTVAAPHSCAQSDFAPPLRFGAGHADRRARSQGERRADLPGKGDGDAAGIGGVMMADGVAGPDKERAAPRQRLLHACSELPGRLGCRPGSGIDECPGCSEKGCPVLSAQAERREPRVPQGVISVRDLGCIPRIGESSLHASGRGSADLDDPHAIGDQKARAGEVRLPSGLAVDLAGDTVEQALAQIGTGKRFLVCFAGQAAGCSECRLTAWDEPGGV